MTVDRQCRTCDHMTTNPEQRQHYKVGLRNCALMPAWKFVTGHHTCESWKPAKSGRTE